MIIFPHLCSYLLQLFPLSHTFNVNLNIWIIWICSQKTICNNEMPELSSLSKRLSSLPIFSHSRLTILLLKLMPGTQWMILCDHVWNVSLKTDKWLKNFSSSSIKCQNACRTLRLCFTCRKDGTKFLMKFIIDCLTSMSDTRKRKSSMMHHTRTFKSS